MEQHTSADVKSILVGLVTCAPLTANAMKQQTVPVAALMPFLQKVFTVRH